MFTLTRSQRTFLLAENKEVQNIKYTDLCNQINYQQTLLWIFVVTLTAFSQCFQNLTQVPEKTIPLPPMLSLLLKCE